MMRFAMLYGLVISSLLRLSGAVTFNVDASKANATQFAVSSFVENNINRGDDGGLYAELVQNRAFQESDGYLSIPGWIKFGNLAVFQDSEVPLSALKRSLDIYVPGNTSRIPGERAGVNNTGWWGIPVKAQPYQASFWIKADNGSPPTGTIDLSLVSLTDHKTYASTSFPASSIKTSWTQLKTTLHPKSDAPDTNNVLSISFGVEDRDQNAWINLVSLFPPTFNNRQNGLRPDLAQVLMDMKPKHIRITGGNTLQGINIDNRYNWTLTLGDLQDRPGGPGYWVGYQTLGLGFKELLDMCEDFGASPVMGVNDGYAADDESIPNTSQLDKYIESAINQLHFVLADPQTNSWGKLRADLGHPEPYALQYVEIGNEDFTSTTYNYRWTRFYNALKAAYPHLNYIATSSIPNITVPAVDVHDFSGPDGFYALFDRYDNWPRNGTQIWELENSVVNLASTNPLTTPETRLVTPTLQGSLAEAVFILGMQRNGDLVIGTSYAPYLANNNSLNWTPNMINFNATTISLSTSYYVHQMISLARADHTHAISTDTNFGPLYWVATSANNTSTFFIQVVNVNSTSQPLSVEISNLKSSSSQTSSGVKASATVLAAGPGQDVTVTNSLDNLNAVVPTVQKVSATRSGNKVQFKTTIRGWSFNVFRLDL